MFDENIKNRFENIYNFLNVMSVSLIYCCEKVFTQMNIWMIGKNLMKHRYLKKKIFKVIKHEKYYWCRLHTHKKSSQKF